ncbi:TPA: antibiotic ABC transporter permease, partial [Streptococcus pneumoniae]
YTPVMVIIEKYSMSQMIQALSLQLFWLFIMIALSQLIWKCVQNYITIQGG